ncbi:hypothetical protein FM036_43455 [Nostoc sp. HG1]|nr:hypothetical protein [Nostoc sp. HG1]
MPTVNLSAQQAATLIGNGKTSQNRIHKPSGLVPAQPRQSPGVVCRRAVQMAKGPEYRLAE